MKNTESHFGLENHDGQITADEGDTYLPKYHDMNVGEFEMLVYDIENWREEKLSAEEIEDLKAILS